MANIRKRQVDDKMIHVRLSAEAHQQLRIEVAKEGMTFQDWVADAIVAKLKKKRTKE